MTTELGLIILRSMYGLCAGAYLVTMVMVGYVYFRTKHHLIRKVFALGCFSFAYCIGSYVFTLGPFSVQFSMIFFPTISFLGAYTFGIYLDLLTDYLNISHWFFRFTSRYLKILGIFLVVTSPFGLVVRPGGDLGGNWMMNIIMGTVNLNIAGKLVLASTATLGLLSLGILLSRYRKSFNKEIWIYFGVTTSLLVNTVDNLLGMGVPYLFSVYAFGFLIEIIRFTVVAMELNFQQQRDLSGQLYTSLQMGAQARLFHQFIHDVNSTLLGQDDVKIARRKIQELGNDYKTVKDLSAQDELQFTQGFKLLENIFRARSKNLKMHLIIPGNIEEKKLPLKSPDFFLIFGNLIQNSIDASESLKTPEVTIEVRRKNQRFEFHYKDNGPGLPKAIRNQIFNPGFSTKGSERGIGLNLVRETLFQYSGRIEPLQSSDGAYFLVSVRDSSS